MQIIKRDGTFQEFDSNKIVIAISKAVEACCPDSIPMETIRVMVEDMHFWDGITIKEIESIIIETLIDWDYNDIAEKYVEYRGKRKAIREAVQQKLDFIERYKNSDNTANATIDANSNVTNRNIAVLNAEAHKPENQEVNLRMLRDKIHELYPDFNHKQMDIDFSTIMYLHDANSQMGMPYCVAISMYPFLLNGIKDLGGLSAAPKNIESFCGMFCNMAFAIASQFKGAVATPGFFLCMDWFIRKRYGDNYWEKSDVQVLSDHSSEKRTLESQIDQWFQQITYTINQPSSARGAQSIFWNLSFFDKEFYDGMYSTFYFPDGTQPIWESLNWLQQHYLHWLNQERLKCMLTFPVCSYALIYKNGKYSDRQAYNFVCQELAEGNSFFIYVSETADSLSSCCRLQNKLNNNTFSFTNGQIGEQTGSLNVITLNINRIIQDWKRDLSNNSPVNTFESIREYLIKILDRVYKYQTAYKEILLSLKEAKLLPAYNSGFIDINRQYLTIGINGLVHAAEFLGIDCTNNDKYADFCHLIFGTIKEQNTLHKQKGLMFNTEQTP